ncbi:MAG: cytochrome ubiquinol oxidase subunit I [Acidimicrobiales bacterium]|jgi:cytochrome d ubiquinol oxidase subunit I
MTLLLSRWQFGITTVFHFIFVPLTIGLALLLAIMQTAAYRSRDDEEKRAKWEQTAVFWRRLFLINFAIGVVTGIVQEFQFGMNWSMYARYVGSVFGAPLAVEALLAFFLESTFLGVWIFGRGRVSDRIHLASIWLVSIGTMLSAYFILAANAWMQHPVGYKVQGNRAVMTDFWAVMTNSTLISSFLHVFTAALVTAAMLMLGISAWHLRRSQKAGQSPHPVFSASAKLALVVGVIAVVATMFFGDNQARLMEKQQPMKMAAAEAVYNTQDGASFSLLTIGNLSGDPIFQIRIPHALSVLADNDWNGPVQGINQIQAQEASKYGPGSYVPVLWVTYWTFRIMVGCGILMFIGLAWGTWLLYRRKVDTSKWFLILATPALALPFLANASGWIFTEMGRQPWVVYGLLRTAKGVSSVGTGYVVATLVGFTAIYTILAGIDFGLMARYAKLDPDTVDEHGGTGGTAGHGPVDDTDSEDGNDRVPALIY